MNIGLCTLYTPEIAEYSKIGVQDKQEYAQRHGYDLHICDHTLDPTRPPSWSKLLMLKTLLPQYEWLMWVDTDTLIMDHTKSLDPICTAHSMYDMIVGIDIPYRLPNCGVFFIRNTPQMASFLDIWWNMADNIFDPIWEQRAFFNLCRQKMIPNIKFTHANYFNSYWKHYKQGEFLVHFTGDDPRLTASERLALMKEWLPRRQKAIIPDL